MEKCSYDECQLNWYGKINCWFKCIGEGLGNFLLLAIRLFWGINLAVHGWQKIQNPQATIESFRGIGIPYPEIGYYLSTGAEFFCAILLVIGLFSRIAAIPIIINMIVAYVMAHSDSIKDLWLETSPFFTQGPFLYLYAALIVFCFGPGKFSLDYFFTGYHRYCKMP